MLKEIYEQPALSIRDTILGRVSPDTGHVFLPDMSITEDDLRNATQVTIAATCGTSVARRPRRQVHDRAPRPWPPAATSTTPPSTATAIPSPTPPPSASSSPSPAKPPTPSPPSANLSVPAARPSPSATSSAQPSPAKPRAPSPPTPGQKSASPPPRSLHRPSSPPSSSSSPSNSGRQVRNTVSDKESLHLVTELNKIPAKLETMLNLNLPADTGTSEGVAAPSITPGAPSSTSASSSSTVGSSPSSAQSSDRRSAPRLSLTDQCAELAKIFSHRQRLPLPRPRHPLPHALALEGALKLKEMLTTSTPKATPPER